MKTQRLRLVMVVCLLGLFSIAAVPQYDPGYGSIRGAVFLDANRNGVMDPGEQGLGWVYFTISSGDYSHTYFSEWRDVDEAGHQYATGTFGPAPLPAGEWVVTFHVPDGYIATTPATQRVYVPGDGDQIGRVYMGLYPVGGVGGAPSVLPRAGLNLAVVHRAVALLAVGSLISVGLGLRSRRRA